MTPGIYAISNNDQVLYVGECQSFVDRFGPRGYGAIHPRNCFRGGQSTNCKVNSRVLALHRRGEIPTLWFGPEGQVGRKLVEVELIRILDPPWNGR